MLAVKSRYGTPNEYEVVLWVKILGFNFTSNLRLVVVRRLPVPRAQDETRSLVESFPIFDDSRGYKPPR